MSSASTGHPRERLFDKYEIGETLGEGAFGVVRLCQRRGTREEFAVKMLDRVELLPAAAAQEARMLRELAHPCVAKLHEVYFDRVFVCFVMELYKGGDMVDGMRRHWKSKGTIAAPVVQNMTKMMVQSIDWLHGKRIVHRDIKPDNYLMDRCDIEDSSCRVYLSDFGTVVELQPEQRLAQSCGTKRYWAPEFYDLDYGLAVDIWAIGVITCGLATGHFPFKTEEETRTQPVKCAGRVTKDCEAFLLATLTGEARRLTAQQAMEHAFLSPIRSTAPPAVEAIDSGSCPGTPSLEAVDSGLLPGTPT